MIFGNLASIFAPQQCSTCHELFPLAELTPVVNDEGRHAGYECWQCVEPDLSPSPQAML